MRVTRIKINKVNDDIVKCNCEITIDKCFIIKGIKMIQKVDKTIIQMPYTTYNSKDRFGNVVKRHMDLAHPIDSETRDYINGIIMDAYNKADENEYIEYFD